MSLLHIDGFEWNPQSLNENALPALGFGKATNLHASAAKIPGRRASSSALSLPAMSFSNAGGYRKSITASQTHVYMGAAVRIPAAGSDNAIIFHIADTSNTVFHKVEVDPLGQVLLTRFTTLSGDTIIATSGFVLAYNVWNYIEFRALNSSSAGILEVKMNGVTWLTVPGLNTRQSGGDFKSYGVGAPGISSSTVAVDYDDFYLLNASGTVNNTWLGDVRVETLRPDAAGTNTALTGTPAGSNFDRVNEAETDLNDYVQSTASGQRDSYNYSAIPAMQTPTILGVQVVSIAKKTDSGTANIKNLAKSGATTVVGATEPLLVNNATHLSIWETNPATGVLWTEAGVNAAEFGVEAA